MSPAQTNVTNLLASIREGDAEARAKLAGILYPQLRRLAQNLMRRERTDHTLQPTALVNEACLRLFGGRIDFSNRAHFLAVAAQIMRQILVDYARQRGAIKRGGELRRVDLDALSTDDNFHSARVLALDAALSRLSEWDERQSRIVEMRFFGGLTEEEIAEVLGLSVRTIKREWSLAKAWLYDQLDK